MDFSLPLMLSFASLPPCCCGPALDTTVCTRAPATSLSFKKLHHLHLQTSIASSLKWTGTVFIVDFSFHFLIQDILLLLLFLFPLYLCSSLFSLPLISEHLFSSFTGASDALKTIDFLFLKSLLEIYLLLSLAREGYLPWHHAIF